MVGNLVSRHAGFANRGIDKEIEIVHGLAEKIVEYEDMLNTCSDICGELDRYMTSRCISHLVSI